MILSAETVAAAAEALRGGQVVVLPAAALADVRPHQYGPTVALERLLQAQAVGGPVLVVHVPLVDRVAAFAPGALDRAGHDASALLGELGRINDLLRATCAAEDLLDRIVPRGPIEVLALEERAVLA